MNVAVNNMLRKAAVVFLTSFESYSSFVEDSSKEWSHTIYKIY